MKHEGNKDFAARLAKACDDHPHAPPANQGRQKWVAENVGVSEEAARKWFKGLSRPRVQVMNKLAEALNVDTAWLSLGITPTQQPKERKATQRKASGAIEVVAGLIELSGGTIAYPDESDPRAEYVHFYAIIDGKHAPFYVALGREIEDEVYEFNLPPQHAELTVLGLIHARPLRPHLIRMPAALVNQHGKNHGGYVSVTIAGDDGVYTSGGDTWQRITKLSGTTANTARVA